jgi:aminoglycoside phosphotransferase (APT) family kinase protein
MVDAVINLWRERKILVDALEHMPQTLCHNDPIEANVFIRTSNPTTLIDWAYAGIGPVGSDLAPTVVGSLLLSHDPLEKLAVLERAAIDAYSLVLDPVASASQIIFSYRATAGLRYGLYGVARLPLLLDRSMHARVEQLIGRPIEEYARRVGRLTSQMICYAAGVREIAAGVSGGATP